MMNTVVGSAIGGLVAVMRPSPAPAYGMDPNGAYAMTVANTSALANGAQPRPVYASAPVVTRAVERPAARARVVYAQPREADVRRTSDRSWGKTALIIGGSSGAGAGVGALVGGKKGALIGGGAATIYESTNR